MKRTRIKSVGRAAIRKRTKFGNVPRIYNGVEYHSRLEAGYAQELDLRVRVGDIQSWRRQVSVKLEVNGVLICRYIVDFVILHNDGREEWVECKGMWTPEAKLKVKLFHALFPSVKLTIHAA